MNKVAGIYGLVAVLTGAGGSAAQLSMYIYSVLALVALAWGLRAVGQVRPPSPLSHAPLTLPSPQEDAKHTLYFAHAFFADHILSTAWTVFFAVVWWVHTPHDGRQEVMSQAQQGIIDLAGGSAARNMSAQERAQAATRLWDDEKGTASAVIVVGWLIKVRPVSP